MTTPPPSHQYPQSLPQQPHQQPGPGYPAAGYPGSPQPAAAHPGTGQPTPVGRVPRDQQPEHFPTTLSQDGRLAWVFGFLGLLGVPILAATVTGLVMLIVGLVQRRKNPVARSVATRAALWGALGVVLGIGYIAALFVFTQLTGGGATFEEAPLLTTILIVWAVAMAVLYPIASIILAIVGLVRPVSRERAAAILGRR